MKIRYVLTPAIDKPSWMIKTIYPSESQIDIVVIRLPRISNFTDFDILKREKDVCVRFVDDAAVQ